MDKVQFEKLKKDVNRRKTIYSLKSKIEDFNFKIIEYEMVIKNLREELEKAELTLQEIELKELD